MFKIIISRVWNQPFSLTGQFGYWAIPPKGWHFCPQGPHL